MMPFHQKINNVNTQSAPQFHACVTACVNECDIFSPEQTMNSVKIGVVYTGVGGGWRGGVQLPIVGPVILVKRADFW